MKENIKIKVKGTQIDEYNEKDDVELRTNGIFTKKGDKYYIKYDESKLSGMEGSTTTLIISTTKVKMKRFGTSEITMEFKEGEKYSSSYKTPYGLFSMDIKTYKVDVKISESDISIFIKYRLHMGIDKESVNTLSVKGEFF